MSRSSVVITAASVLAVVLFGGIALTAGLVAGPGPKAAAALTRPVSAPTPVATTQPPPASVSSSPPALAGYDHVVVVVMENHSLETVLGSAEAPYLSSLAVRNSYATGYTGISHPSLPNYLALVGGSTFGISSDCTACFISAPSIADRVEASGRTWKAYQEGMPTPCFVGSSGRYAQKHDPFIYFDSIRSSAARCANIVPFVQMGPDFAAAGAPNLAFVTPDLCNDGHDCPLGIGDAWLARQVPAIMASPSFAGSRSLLIVTFDEGEGGSDRVLTVLAGSGVRAGFHSTRQYDHYSLLRTIEDGWSLAPLAAGDGAASPMLDFFG